MPAYILENSQNALSELPKSQAALTRSIANQVRCRGKGGGFLTGCLFDGDTDVFKQMQVGRVVMLAWGTANRSKEEIARREARRGGGSVTSTAGEATG